MPKIKKHVKGPNAVAYNKSFADVYMTENLQRKHYVSPGEKLTCNCCGKAVWNIYQHLTMMCEPSQYYMMLLDKHHEAYLFFLQWHKKHPDVWEYPGNFVMMNSNLTKQMMEKLPFDKFHGPPSMWNVLMPIETGDVKEGKKKTGKCFADLFLELVLKMCGGKLHH